MYDRVLHNRWSKLATAVAGAVLMAVAINLFSVPQGLYTGGLLGLCQVIRTLLVTKLGVTANFDIAGLIYLASNVPLLLLAYKTLGRTFVLRLTICTVFSSLFVDRVHQQNITVQVTIMTKVMDIKPFQAILHRLDRGLTRWTGQGAYTGEPVQVLCICVSKYELETLQQEVNKIDPAAFFIGQEGGRTGGNFKAHLS